MGEGKRAGWDGEDWVDMTRARLCTGAHTFIRHRVGRRTDGPGHACEVTAGIYRPSAERPVTWCKLLIPLPYERSVAASGHGDGTAESRRQQCPVQPNASLQADSRPCQGCEPHGP